MGQPQTLDPHRREHRKVAVATLVGTTIEWYDFFVYAFAAGLVFDQIFFDPFVASLGETGARLLSFATVGVSFLFRPLGAMIAGHFGDRLGRKLMLVLTLLFMGGATFLIGLVPVFASIGMWAPVLLVLLRILQGISAGGEWGGAALMAVEHAPSKKRGLFGGFPQIGVPLGMLLASGVLGLVSSFTTAEQFLSWGWRISFLLSIVLIVVGLLIRLGIAESPVFAEMGQLSKQAKLPIVDIFRYCGPAIVFGALTFAANNAVGYMLTGGYVQSYATRDLGMDQAPVQWVVTLAAAAWICTTMGSALLSDKYGRTFIYKVGFVWGLLWVFPMFWLIDSTNLLLLAIATILLTISIGFTYGPQAALFAEMFPAQVRYSGAATAYAFGAVLGGAFAPTIATWLQSTFGTSMAVSTYLFVMTLIGLLATFGIKDRTGKQLGKDAMDIPGAEKLAASMTTQN